MRLLVLSDLHLELKPRWSLRRRWPDYDVAVVAGDLAGSIALGVAMLATHPILGGRPAIYVPGNHEYWEDEIGQAEQAGHWVALGTNVHLLQGSSVVIDGVRFAGATLWTDYALDGDPIGSARIASETMKDHDLIGLRRPSGETAAFMPGDAMVLHQRHRTFIEKTLAKPFDGPMVVVTHHAPSARSVAATYKDDDGNPAYASDLEPTLLSRQPDLWVHGHVHNSNDYRIGATRVVSNPKGYGPSRSRDGLFRKSENRAFNPALVFEI